MRDWLPSCHAYSPSFTLAASSTTRFKPTSLHFTRNIPVSPLKTWSTPHRRPDSQPSNTIDFPVLGNSSSRPSHYLLFLKMLLSSSRSYDQFLHPGGLEPPSTTLSCIPEDRRVTDQGESHPGNPSVSHPGEPPAKKQRVECESCHETLGEHKTLTRHQETCREHCAKLGISPKPFRCDECPQKSFSRKDVLRRHVQTIH
jgi:hypothetical protein